MKKLNKKTISMLLGVVVLALGVAFGVILVGQDQDFREKAAPATSMTLNTSDPTPKVGEQFTVSVNIDTGENAVTVTELYLDFDASKLEVLDVINGSFFPSPEGIGPTIDNLSGTVDYVIFLLPGNDPVTGVGTVINLSMRAKVVGTAVVSLSPDTIVGAVAENSQNVLVNSFPLTVDIQQAIGGEIGGGDTQPTSTPVLESTSVTPTAVPTTVINPTVVPTSVFATVVPTAAEDLPEVLPDSGVGEVAVVLSIFGVFLLLGSMAFVL